MCLERTSKVCETRRHTSSGTTYLPALSDTRLESSIMNGQTAIVLFVNRGEIVILNSRLHKVAAHSPRC
jgi:hypothetical protein